MKRVEYWSTNVKKSYLRGLIVEEVAFAVPGGKLVRLIYIVPFTIPWWHHRIFWGTRLCYLVRIIVPIDGGWVE